MNGAEHRIEWTKLALERILEIAEFRFPTDTGRAQEWMGRVIEHADQLKTFPNIGRRISPEKEQNVRRLLFKDVWIIYEVLKDHVLVLTVRHVRERPKDDF